MSDNGKLLVKDVANPVVFLAGSALHVELSCFGAPDGHQVVHVQHAGRELAQQAVVPAKKRDN